MMPFFSFAVDPVEYLPSIKLVRVLQRIGSGKDMSDPVRMLERYIDPQNKSVVFEYDPQREEITTGNGVFVKRKETKE